MIYYQRSMNNLSFSIMFPDICYPTKLYLEKLRSNQLLGLKNMYACYVVTDVKRFYYCICVSN